MNIHCRLKVLVRASLVGLMLLLSGITAACAAEKEMNLLCWPGYEESKLISIFEKKYGVKVNYKVYIGGDQMFSIFTHSHEQYDVVVSDSEYVAKLLAADRISALDPGDYDFSSYFEPFKHFPPVYLGGKLYGVLVHWGSNGLVYNTTQMTKEEATSYSILWDQKMKGHVGIWDWYLPSMGVLSRATGNADAYQISDGAFAAFKAKLMSLRPQVGAIFPTPPEMLSALANEEAWIVPAGGEWVAAVLQAQGKPIDWSVPKEGGILWSEALTIAKDAPHPTIAKLYIQWMQSPEAQALLSQAGAIQAQVPNAKAYDLMPANHKAELKVANASDALALLSRLSIRTLPQNQSEGVWQDAWSSFKAAQ